MNQEKIGEFIKKIRKSNNLTQKEFAASLGVTFQAVSKWENGKNIPDIIILKEISKKYNVDINEIIEGEKLEKKELKEKRNLLYLIILLLIILISISIFILKNNQNNFELKKLTTACPNFNITGSVAFNEKTSSFYISEIEFCGEEDINYQKIKCVLYEEQKENINKVSTCQSKTNITLKEYLKNQSIDVTDYKHSCKNFEKRKFYIEIEAIKENDEIITYKVPLKIENVCD